MSEMLLGSSFGPREAVVIVCGDGELDVRLVLSKYLSVAPKVELVFKGLLLNVSVLESISDT